MKSAYQQQVSNQGFSLIEILVSIVVLSIGLLGLGGLQIAALKGSNESHFRNEASLLQMDLANRMRSNARGINDYIDTIPNVNILVTCSAAITACDGSSACSPIQLAQFDLNKIACSAKNLLPSGKVEITKIADPAVSCAVGVGIVSPYYGLRFSWTDAVKKGVVDADAHKKSISLNCFTP